MPLAHAWRDDALGVHLHGSSRRSGEWRVQGASEDNAMEQPPAGVAREHARAPLFAPRVYARGLPPPGELCCRDSTRVNEHRQRAGRRCAGGGCGESMAGRGGQRATAAEGSCLPWHPRSTTRPVGGRAARRGAAPPRAAPRRWVQLAHPARSPRRAALLIATHAPALSGASPPPTAVARSVRPITSNIDAHFPVDGRAGGGGGGGGGDDNAPMPVAPSPVRAVRAKTSADSANSSATASGTR